jgi:cytoplasmic iron level regulating protein YaaA (DUF328/UPF0246 family)
MKIIISPSKTALYQSHPVLKDGSLLYEKQTKKLLAVIRKLSQKDLAKALSIKGDLLQETHAFYKNIHQAEKYPALPSFNGLVFKQLHMDTYTTSQLNYIQSHVRILDALYGVLEPHTMIAPYRLDMKAKLGLNLYEFWNVTPYFDTETIINLASNEFSAMIRREMISISFLQKRNGVYKNQATYSKMARGLMLDFMIRNEITTVDGMKHFNEGGYRYNDSLSDPHTLTFTR